MPYLPVDLDGKRKAEDIERGLGLPRHSVVGGNVDLWEAVWRAWMGGKSPEEAELVDELALSSAYGPDPRIRAALVARDFLEPAGDRHRVRGAKKWLFGLEGKKRGGQASKKNLKQGAQPGSQPGNAVNEMGQSPAKPGPMPELTSGCEPGSFTQHPAPSTQKLLSSANADAPQADTVAAMGGLASPKVAAAAKPERRRAPREEKPPDPRHHPLKLRLMATFLEIRGVAYAFGARDAKALSDLLALGPDDEIDRRWRRGLQAQFRERCDTLLDLRGRWNALTGTTGPPARAGGARFFQAQDADKTSLARTGTLNDF